MANPIIKIKRGSVTPSSLQPGELAVDLTAKTIFVGQNNTVPLAIGGEGVFATKVYTDSAVAAANTTLTAAILAEETARIDADGGLQANITAEASSRSTADSVLQTNITAEETSRIAADGVLQTNINAEKGRIDAILTASTADKDSFAEIVSLINSVDTENDTAFGAYVVSNNIALAAESSTRAANDATLQANLNAAESALQSSIATETTNRTTADTTLQSNITAEATSRAAADTTLQSNITAEETSRTTADTTLQANIDAEMTARTTADTALSGRSATLETKTTDLETKTQNIDLADTVAGTTVMSGVLKNASTNANIDFTNNSLTFIGGSEFGSVFVNTTLEVDGNTDIGSGVNGGNLTVGGNITATGNLVGNGTTSLITDFIIDGGSY